MMKTVSLIAFLVIISATNTSLGDDADFEIDFESGVLPILKKHCLECHGATDEIRGDVDFTKLGSSGQISQNFELWKTVSELVADGVMPPNDETQLTDDEKSAFHRFQTQLLNRVEAHPGIFRPRRLSAHEFRNTLKSLLGFDLEVAIIEAEQTIAERSLVMKLLPADPPGPSGYTNDTSQNPITTVVWNQTSYLIDTGLQRLFSPDNRNHLEAYVGPIRGKHLTAAQAQSMFRKFIEKAYRQPLAESVSADAIGRLNGKSDEELEVALREELKTVLMSPPFLYRGLLHKVPSDDALTDDESSTASVREVSPYELAQRLGYFIWADMPDEELMRAARNGDLTNPKLYAAQIDRMIASPKSRNLATDFAWQWFSFGEIEIVSDNPPIADALLQQPIDFVHYLFRENRPLLELVDSRTTFANSHTAKYYPSDRKQIAKPKRMKGFEIRKLPNQRVTLENTKERGGLITMPGVLAMNRGPILRGTWILERVLGEHLPEPPPDVGQVKPNIPGENLTFRQRFEQHRSNATCAVCHNKIDPLGFALQQYDNAGNYKKSPIQPKKKKKNKTSLSDADDPKRIDTSGKMPSGETFDDFAGLKKILVTTERRRIIENIVRQTMSYALCRKLEIHDIPTVQSIADKLDANDGTYRDLIHEVANSLPFTKTAYRAPKE